MFSGLRVIYMCVYFLYMGSFGIGAEGLLGVYGVGF